MVENGLHTTRILLGLWLALSLTSCYEPIVMDPKTELPIIVRCILTDTTSTQTLTLNYACRHSGESLKPVCIAEEVSISDDSSSYTFKHVANGNWEADNFNIEYNKKYHLKIAVGDIVLSAETTFPNHIELQTEFIYFEHPGSEWGSGTYAVRLQKQDGTPYQDFCNLWVISRSPRNRAESATYKDGHSYTSEFLVTTNEYADNFNTCSLSCMDLACFFVEARKNANEYQESKLIELYGKRRASEILWNDNRASHSPYFLTRYYPQKSVHRKVIRIPYPKNYSNRNGIEDIENGAESIMRGDEYSFLVLGDYNMNDPESWKIPVVGETGKIDISAHMCDFMCVDYYVISDEYDVFLKELYTRGINADDGVAMDILYNQENLPSNVSNGYGVFGALSVLKCLPY